MARIDKELAEILAQMERPYLFENPTVDFRNEPAIDQIASRFGNPPEGSAGKGRFARKTYKVRGQNPMLYGDVPTSAFETNFSGGRNLPVRTTMPVGGAGNLVGGQPIARSNRLDLMTQQFARDIPTTSRVIEEELRALPTSKETLKAEKALLDYKTKEFAHTEAAKKAAIEADRALVPYQDKSLVPYKDKPVSKAINKLSKLDMLFKGMNLIGYGEIGRNIGGKIGGMIDEEYGEPIGEVLGSIGGGAIGFAGPSKFGIASKLGRGAFHAVGALGSGIALASLFSDPQEVKSAVADVKQSLPKEEKKSADEIEQLLSDMDKMNKGLSKLEGKSNPSQLDIAFMNMLESQKQASDTVRELANRAETGRQTMGEMMGY